MRSRAPALAALVLAVAVAVPSEADQGQAVSAATRPNIVVVMTDDQDLASMAAMPRVQRLLAAEGTTFARHTVEFSLCCPSRATYLSGRLSHNSNVRGTNPPAGGYGNLDAAHTLPVWLQTAGYTTAHLGKYPNGYGMESHPLTGGVPPGWDEWRAGLGSTGGALDANVYLSYGYTLNEDGVPTTYGTRPDDYHDDVLTRHAVDFVQRAASAGRPFFLDLSYLNPHWESTDATTTPSVEGVLSNRTGESLAAPPRPAPRHAGMFAGAEVPRTPAFNEADVSDKPAFVRERAPLSDELVARLDRWRQARLESLQSVDEGVARIVAALDAAGVLEDTYIVFTSDNGWIEGQHRLVFTKVHAYEPSTRVPLVVRGPGVKRGREVRDWTSNVDVPATLLDVAGARPDRPLDGMSLARYFATPERRLHRAVLHQTGPDAAGYAAVRAGDWKYVEYRTGERELYDLAADPEELANRASDPAAAGTTTALAALLARLTGCVGPSCVVTDVPSTSWR